MRYLSRECQDFRRGPDIIRRRPKISEESSEVLKDVKTRPRLHYFEFILHDTFFKNVSVKAVKAQIFSISDGVP